MTTPTDHDAVASTFRHLVHDLLNSSHSNSSHHYDEFCGGGNNLYNLSHERITWESVNLITIYSFVLWATCLIGYELFRRDPIVGKYVYDRKRLVQPDRSPPPLMLSRSLWPGRKEDGVTQTRTKENCCSFSCCCRVKPAMLEIIFLTLDTNYVRYSRLANSARSRREDDMSYYTCCRTGWYHNNCWNNYRGRRRGRRRASSSSSSSSSKQQQQQQQQQTDATTANTTTATTTTTTTTIDEDGYEFYPEYDNTYSHLYNGDDAQYSRGGSLDEYTMVVDAISKRRVVVDVGDGDRNGNGDLVGGEEKEEEDVEQQQQVPPPTQNRHKRLTTYDLFPEDDPRKFRKAFAKTRSEYNYIKSQGVGKSGSLCIFPNDDDDDDDDDDDKDKYDEENDHVGEVKDDGEEKDEWVPIDWNSKNNDNGIVKNGLVMQTNSSENSTRNHKPSTTSTTTNNNMDDAKVIYPSRLKRLFLPLGFNSWVSVYDHLHDFLLLHELFRVCRYMNLMSPLSPMRIRRDNIFGRRRKTKIMLHDIPVTPPGKELSDEEKELLRCAGLDVYLFIRFVRFGFDATFYPFLLALVAAMPLYHTKAEFKRMDGTYDITHGFFTLTISQIPAGSGVIYWITFLTVTLYLGILRRLWMEWEIFIKLRHDFLAKGDTYYYKRPTYLQKYQNTCIVECVPKSHRSDTNLKDVFESLFPGEIEHAEMIIDTSTLEGILHKRRALIEKYDNVIAKYRYSQWLAKNKHTAGQLPPEPKKPMYKVGGGRCSRTKQDAIEYYNNEIIKLEELAAKEYDRIVETRMKCHRSSLMKPSGFEEMKQLLDSPVNSCEDGDENALTRLYTLLIPSKVRQAFGEESEFFTGTGVVTFKSIAKKEFAIQSNLSGHPHWMVTEDAPDPRDLFWSNIGVDVRNIESRKVLVQIFLFIGLLVWSYFVGFIQQLVERTIQSMDEYGVVITVIKESYGGAIRDVAPIWVVAFILMQIPNLFYTLAINVIRFKTHTQVDNFVLFWNTSYHLANIFVSIVSIVSVGDATTFLLECPTDFLTYLANSIIGQAPYFMNLIILATGQETMLQLLQWRSVIKHAFFRPLINLNAKSRRYHDWLDTAPVFEEAFIFGFFAPILVYGLMIAVIFAFMVPILLGACALFFWTAAKVHTHNALFVYCQRFEGGGKLFYYWNRIIFVILYSAIVVFAAILALKQFPRLAISFSVLMVLITSSVGKAINRNLVYIHSTYRSV